MVETGIEMDDAGARAFVGGQLVPHRVERREARGDVGCAAELDLDAAGGVRDRGLARDQRDAAVQVVAKLADR